MNLAALARNEEEPSACNEQEEEYYNATSVLFPANPFEFISGGEWKKEDFDLEAFFEELDFDAECETLGGETVKHDINVGCASDDGGFTNDTLENFRFCRPPSCHPYEHMFKQVIGLAFVGFFVGCPMIEVVNDVLPSMECLQGMTMMYNNTVISDYSPEMFIAGGGIEVTEAVRIVKLCTENVKLFSQICILSICLG